MTTFIYPYKTGSQSVNNIKTGLKARIIRLTQSKFNPTKNKTILNWGSSTIPKEYTNCRIINSPDVVHLCSNKLTFFQKFGEHPSLIEHTTDHNKVLEALEKGHSICIRHKLTGHSGEGLEIFAPKDLLQKELPKALLYTVYKKKKEEFRCHVVDNKIIDIQRKALRTDDERPETPNFQIRSHNNGFIYVRNEEFDKAVIKIVETTVLDLHKETGLDFGAYDVIYNSKEKKAYVLEINTAPGLTGTTLENYVNAFKEMGL
jgi:glutathione synthase/RimK-type ligase-like ATP-grasp enzyme